MYVFQTVKQSTKDNQSYKQYSNATGRGGTRQDATGRDNQSESSIAPTKQGGGIKISKHLKSYFRHLRPKEKVIKIKHSVETLQCGSSGK